MDMNGPAHRRSGAVRPRRGVPHETRGRLLTAAAKLFNREGFYGTDSNAIAKAAGYSTGVFYKHFKDKREIFLAAYEQWSVAEWKQVAAVLASGGSDRELAQQLVLMFIDVHTEWRRFARSVTSARDVASRTSCIFGPPSGLSMRSPRAKCGTWAWTGRSLSRPWSSVRWRRCGRDWHWSDP